MYVVFMLTNLIFNYTVPCCLGGLSEGEGRKKSGKTSMVCRQKRQPGSLALPFADAALTVQTPEPARSSGTALPLLTFNSQAPAEP